MPKGKPDQIQLALKAAHMSVRSTQLRRLRHTTQIVAAFFDSLRHGLTIELVPGKPLTLPRELMQAISVEVKKRNDRLFVESVDGEWIEQNKTTAQMLNTIDYSTFKLVPGQKWIPRKIRTDVKPRTIVWANCPPPMYPNDTRMTVGYVCDPEEPKHEHPEFPYDAIISVATFSNWIKYHRAICREMIE